MSTLDQLKMNFLLGDKVIEVYPAAEVDEAVENLEADLAARDQRITELAKDLEDAQDDASHGASEAADLLRGLGIAQSRIAELMATRVDMAAAAADYDRARAEVPEWCKEFIAKLANECGAHALARLTAQYADQLRACGIETA